MYFYLIVLSLLTAILQLKNRSINKFYSFVIFSSHINDVILLLICLALMCCIHIFYSLNVISPTPLHHLKAVLKDSLSVYFFMCSMSHGV